MGFGNATLTIEQLAEVSNVTSAAEFFINVNHDIYEGMLYFILLFVLWIILFMAAQKANDQILNNLMYSGAVVTVISLVMRGVYVYHLGVARGLISDYQMWVFPLITSVIAFIIWATKE